MCGHDYNAIPVAKPMVTVSIETVRAWRAAGIPVQVLATLSNGRALVRVTGAR